MGSTILIALGPALVRLYPRYLPSTFGLSGSTMLTFVTIEAILVVVLVLSFRRGHKVRPFPQLMAAFAAIQLCLPWSTSATFANLLRAAGAPI